MKKIDLLCVGKIKEPFYRAALEEYSKRLSRYCSFSVTEIPDAGDSIVSVITESAALSGKIGGYTVLLDRTGASVTSEDFARALDAAFTRGFEKVHVIIGGSRGVSDGIKNAADKVYNFGAVTYPHQLMRVIAAEQIYRAMCILNGAPYHK